MCGIMGYVGNRSAKDVVYAGLKRLEYRGYDSVGIAVLDDRVYAAKAVGDTSQLSIEKLPTSAPIGIGHTRWATHGKPSVKNAHPHTVGNITIVHNGIVENYEELKELIDSKALQSETDSEVLEAVDDLAGAGVQILTIGQYLRPSLRHLPVAEYVTPEKFAWYKEQALARGLRYVESGPMVRSSYMAEKAMRSCRTPK